jgi:hypothetical protein
MHQIPKLLTMWSFDQLMRKTLGPCLLLAFCLLPQASPGQSQAHDGGKAAVLWTDPQDIRSRNLFYGPGGEQDQPAAGPVTFVSEDPNGHNPKLDVRDSNGTEWRVKPGGEARPETAASRLLWSVGFLADEDYFVPKLKVDNLPAHLERGQTFVHHHDEFNNVRLKRHRKTEKKKGEWKWRKNRFTGTREFNGLRVMMAVMSDWDLKDDNNSIYEDKESGKELYVKSDVGSTFGGTQVGLVQSLSKGNLKVYQHARFISKVTPDYVDFNFPTRPPLLAIFALPQYIGKLRQRWIGRHIPRADAKWVGSLLAQLSHEQICDAFRAAGYSPADIEGFATAVESRIAQLNRL